MSPSKLIYPNGVTRDVHCSPHVGLDNCHALQFEFKKNENGSEGSCIVWRDGLKNVKPIEDKRLSELRPRDEVMAFGRRTTLVSVLVYR